MSLDPIKIYSTGELLSPEGLKVLFTSDGINKKTKLIEYTYIGEYNGTRIFNLGFGDYNSEFDTINDQIISGNNDGRMVLNTVLSTIPLFFKYYPYDMLVVRGSDSRPTFKDECNRTCSKNCGENCRKFNQRIRIYRTYIDLNFHQLSKEY
jgi:hypothetical protein